MCRAVTLAAVAIVLPGVAVAVAAGTDAGPAQSDALSPIEVTAQKLRAPELNAARIYDPQHDLLATSGTAADVLNGIPAVDVDADGVVSLRGDSNVTLLIDGKPAAQLTGAAAADGLFQLPASEIVRIEVMAHPPAEYKAEGSAGIINIVTRRPRADASSGQMQASVGNAERYNIGASGNTAVGSRITLGGGLGFRQDQRQRDISDTRVATDPATGLSMVSGESVNEHIRRLTPSLRASIDVALDPQDALTFSFLHRERHGARHFDQIDQSGAADAAPASLSRRASAGRE